MSLTTILPNPAYPDETSHSTHARQLPLTSAQPFGMLESYAYFSEESPTISKRIPPSQRPERKLDETARAIANARDAEKGDKPARAERSGNTGTQEDWGSRNKSHKATGGPAPTSSSKRPKQP